MQHQTKARKNFLVELTTISGYDSELKKLTDTEVEVGLLYLHYSLYNPYQTPSTKQSVFVNVWGAFSHFITIMYIIKA